MKSMLNKITFAIGLSTALLVSSVSADELSESFTYADSVAAKLQEGLHSSSPSLRKHLVRVDNSAPEFVEQYGGDLVPVILTGKRFMSNKEGTYLLQPQTTFMITDNGLKNTSEALMEIELASSTKWPSLPLPEGIAKTGDLYVFTDPTCGYCTKVDEEVEQYLTSGVQVHYIPYPRAGVSNLEQPGFSRWAAAACSDEPAKAYHEIALGTLDKYEAPININAPCIDIVKDGYAYGQLLGLTGTPYLFAKSVSGTVVATPGYMPAEQLGPQIGIVIKRDLGMDLLR
jgi:thiol:disulfide interchange protein DsbC